jgi:hypothetical protein
LDEPQPYDLAHVVLEVDQELGEPPRIVPEVQSTDQRGAFGVGRSRIPRSSRAAGSPRAAITRCPVPSFRLQDWT